MATSVDQVESYWSRGKASGSFQQLHHKPNFIIHKRPSFFNLIPFPQTSPAECGGHMLGNEERQGVNIDANRHHINDDLPP